MTSRTDKIEVRVTRAEKEEIARQANAAETGMSDFVRQRALGKQEATERPAPKPEDADFMERRAAELQREGLPAHNARILAARERNRNGPRIGLPERYRPSEAKRRQLHALREAFAKQFGGDAA